MDIKRNVLLAGMFALAFLLLIRWNNFQKVEIEKTSNLSEETSLPITEVEKNTERDIPVFNQNKPVTKDVPVTKHKNNLIQVTTDTLELIIDPVGGDVIKASLPKYLKTEDVDSPPFEIMNRNDEVIYLAQSGLIGNNGIDDQEKRPVYTSDKNHFIMTNKDPLFVDLHIKTKENISITKRFIFTSDSYLVKVQYLINNKSDKPWSANLFGQIKRNDYKPDVSSGFGIKPFLGAAITTEEKNYKKLSLSTIDEKEFKQTFKGGWVAFVQHYFISAWIPDKESTNNYSIRKMNDKNIYIMGFIGSEKTISPNGEGDFSAELYIGPKDVKKLEVISDYLDLTVDYGWLWWIAKPLHAILSSAHSILGNWGWSIICLTLIIKMIFFPLSNKAYLSMAAMRKVTPKMTEIREKYGDNRQKLQEEMMKLYRTEKINPLGGCLPMIIQMPVFISLYWTLLESVEIRQAPFIGWITDLSVMDPYFCLPLLMGASMFLQQKMNPTPPDPTQAKIMQLMPIMFTFMFLWFPAGLVLYWLVNNIISMVHQAYINYKMEGSLVKK